MCACWALAQAMPLHTYQLQRQFQHLSTVLHGPMKLNLCAHRIVGSASKLLGLWHDFWAAAHMVCVATGLTNAALALATTPCTRCVETA